METHTCGRDDSFFEEVKSAVKFQQDGKWGLKSSTSDDILLSAKYDKIEVCADFIYTHNVNRHKFFYKDGYTEEGPDDDDDYRFYENGKIGLRHPDGTAFLPAQYDEIIDWGEDSDVVYTRNGEEYHYYNHHQKEILTDVKELPEDQYPLCPFSIEEDQNRGVLICVEPIRKGETENDCYTYGQWCRLSRMPCSEVSKFFSDCNVYEMPQAAIDLFYNKDTYIYAARKCKANSISECIKKLKDLDCYDAAWNYLIKITTNSRTRINAEDLYQAILFYEDLDLDVCMSFHIAIGTDDNLADGEIEYFQIHFFWDNIGEFLSDPFQQTILPKGNIKAIDNALNQMDAKERQRQIANAFWSIEYLKGISWQSTLRLLNHLKSLGCNNASVILDKHLDLNPYYIEEICSQEWKFKKKLAIWAINNGGQLNHISDGESRFDKFVNALETAKSFRDNSKEALRSIREGELFAEWLKSIGAISATEQREKIKANLVGLNPREVFSLVEST